MKKVLLLCLLFCNHSFSQTGPGGIGNNIGTSALKLWLDANNGTNVTGTAITSWTDRSGSSNTATPPATANRPTLVSNTLNTFPIVRFDGTDDYFDVGTATSLNMTQWSFFVVGKVNTNKNYNYWFGKGNDGTENYEFLSYTDPFMHTPIYFSDGTRSWLNTTAPTTSVNNYSIWQYDFTGAGRNIYLNGSLNTSDVVAKTPQTNNLSAYIGNERSTTGRFFNGDMAEIIMFNTLQTDVQKIIVQNYLSAKYNIPLASNDVYVGDNAGNGNYDYNVAGIGQSSTGNTNTSFSTSTSSGLGMTYVSGFNNGDYILTGHNLKTGNNQQFTDVGGMTGSFNARWTRIWYIDITNTSTNMTINITFDMSDGGAIVTPTIASNYVLLYRAGQSGNWTELATANNIAGDVINFTNYTLVNDGYYTIGTKNYVGSPLPVEILNFEASLCSKGICLNWQTPLTSNNDDFEVQRSVDGINWLTIKEIKEATNSTLSYNHYATTDESLLKEVPYYRLKYTDKDGISNYSRIISIDLPNKYSGSLKIFPNPSIDKELTLYINSGFEEQLTIRILDNLGKTHLNQQIIKDKGEFKRILPVKDLKAGLYYIQINSLYRREIIKFVKE